MHTDPNTAEDKRHSQPRLFLNDLTLNIPLPEDREEECTRIRQWDG